MAIYRDLYNLNSVLIKEILEDFSDGYSIFVVNEEEERFFVQ